MIGYETIQHAEKNVLTALRREGELSDSELVLTTSLPYDVVRSVVNQLQKRGKVEIRRAAESQIELIRLR